MRKKSLRGIETASRDSDAQTIPKTTAARGRKEVKHSFFKYPHLKIQGNVTVSGEMLENLQIGQAIPYPVESSSFQIHCQKLGLYRT